MILKSFIQWVITHPTGAVLAAILGLEVADLSVDLLNSSSTSTNNVHVDNMNVSVDDSWSLVNNSDHYAGPSSGREITENSRPLDLSQFHGKSKEEIIAMLSSTETS